MMVVEYFYPNEAAQPLLWRPVLFAYTLLISGADLLILAAIAHLLGVLRRAIPLLTTLGLAFFAVVLLGPLADLGAPHRAPLIFLTPHVAPTASVPGVSLIALQSVLWVVGMVLAVVFALLIFSYPSYIASTTSAGIRRAIHRALSLNVNSEEKYSSVLRVAKVVGAVMLFPMVMWGIYPTTLLVIQTWNPIWRNWTLLPVIYFVETFCVATASFLLFYYAMSWRSVGREILEPMLRVHGASSVSVAGLIGLQIAVWDMWSPSVSAMVSYIVPILYLVIALMLVSFAVSFVAVKFPAATLAVSLVTFAGTLANKWNILINAQTISKTGLAYFEPHLHGPWVLETAAPIAAGVLLFVVLSSIFPLEVRGNS